MHVDAGVVPADRAAGFVDDGCGIRAPDIDTVAGRGQDPTAGLIGEGSASIEDDTGNRVGIAECAARAGRTNEPGIRDGCRIAVKTHPDISSGDRTAGVVLNKADAVPGTAVYNQDSVIQRPNETSGAVVHRAARREEYSSVRGAFSRYNRSSVDDSDSVLIPRDPEVGTNDCASCRVGKIICDAVDVVVAGIVELDPVEPPDRSASLIEHLSATGKPDSPRRVILTRIIRIQNDAGVYNGSARSRDCHAKSNFIGFGDRAVVNQLARGGQRTAGDRGGTRDRRHRRRRHFSNSPNSAPRPR